jgi:hypothetical protein
MMEIPASQLAFASESDHVEITEGFDNGVICWSRNQPVSWIPRLLVFGLLITFTGTCDAYFRSLRKENTNIDPATRLKWENAGADFGWISLDPSCNWVFTSLKPSTEAIPAFRFSAVPKDGLHALPSPTNSFGLWFDGIRIPGGDLGELQKFKALQWLHIENTNLTDLEIKSVAKITSLLSLSLEGTKVTAEDLNTLATQQTIQMLSIQRANVKDGDLKSIATFKNLRVLNLG